MYAAQKCAVSNLHRVYLQMRRELVRFARARSGDAGEAEDIVQDVWLRLETRNPGPVLNAPAYLFQMANNVALDRQRERHRRQLRDRCWRDLQTDFAEAGAEIRDYACNAEDHAIERQEAQELHAAIATLPRGARTVLMLHKIDGLSHSEVAERLAISRSGVEKHMAVAMRHLREALVE